MASDNHKTFKEISVKVCLLKKWNYKFYEKWECILSQFRNVNDKYVFKIQSVRKLLFHVYYSQLGCIEHFHNEWSLDICCTDVY